MCSGQRLTLQNLDEILVYRRGDCFAIALNDILVKVNALWELQSESQVEFDALLPSVLDRALKGEL